MVELRITKYDPSLRDERGCFTGDEWTEISDIGRQFSDGVLTLENYLAVEDEYVSVIQQFMSIVGIKQLCVSALEVNGCDVLPRVLQ